jgi:hypothetical protein
MVFDELAGAQNGNTYVKVVKVPEIDCGIEF